MFSFHPSFLSSSMLKLLSLSCRISKGFHHFVIDLNCSYCCSYCAPARYELRIRLRMVANSCTQSLQNVLMGTHLYTFTYQIGTLLMGRWLNAPNHHHHRERRPIQGVVLHSLESVKVSSTPFLPLINILCISRFPWNTLFFFLTILQLFFFFVNVSNLFERFRSELPQ